MPGQPIVLYAESLEWAREIASPFPDDKKRAVARYFD
jgi:hypothetical protein